MYKYILQAVAFFTGLAMLAGVYCCSETLANERKSSQRISTHSLSEIVKQQTETFGFTVMKTRDTEDTKQLRYVVSDTKQKSSTDKKRVYQSIEDKILPKIEADIEIILKNGWADTISSKDLYHCHLLIPEFYPINTKGYEISLSARNIKILYHSRELQNIIQDRNIVSGLNSKPRTINGKPTVHPVDLKCWVFCQIDFGLSEKDLNASAGYSFDKVVKRGKYYFGIKF